MKLAKTITAFLLALPLIVFGSNKFLNFMELPPGDGSQGDQLLQLMHEGGLMSWIALSHIVIGLLLLLPRTRFLGALLQLPISLGMVAFHATMLPGGTGMAAVMLALNAFLLLDAQRLQGVLEPKSD